MDLSHSDDKRALVSIETVYELIADILRPLSECVAAGQKCDAGI
jgi:hypothetical protein